MQIDIYDTKKGLEVTVTRVNNYNDVAIAQWIMKFAAQYNDHIETYDMPPRNIKFIMERQENEN